MVACITYTNAAVHEIQERLERMDLCGAIDACEVETIHTFCLKHVFGPHAWRVPSFRRGSRLLTPDDEEFTSLVKLLVSNHGLDRRAAQDFEQLTRGVERLPGTISQAAADEYWAYLDERGLVDFSGIIYWSRVLLREYPFVARALGSRYAWILVDEFQDTSRLQVAALAAIHKWGRTRFFVVGDPHQSIMSVNGADPSLMARFAKHISARSDLELLGNFRSSRKILSVADALCERGAPMEALGEHRDFPCSPQWHAVEDMESGVRYVFLPALQRYGIRHSEAAVLAPWWTSLVPLARTLRTNGVSVLGPGARPYHRSHHVIAPLIEEMAAVIAEPIGRGIRLVRHELRRMMSSVAGEYRGPTGLASDILIVGLLRRIRSAAALDAPADAFLESVGLHISAALFSEGFASRSQADEIANSAYALIAEIRQQEVKLGLPRTTVRHLGMFAKGSGSLRLSTMHAAKGREWAAVAVIDVFDGRVPHFSYTNWGTPDEERAAIYEEGRRVLYVSLTRAKQLLMVFTLAQPDRKTRPSPFLEGIFSSPHKP